MSKTSLVWLTVLALTGSFTSLNGLVIKNEKVNEFIITSSLTLKNAPVDQKSSQFNNVQPQTDDLNPYNLDMPAAVNNEYVAKGDEMLQPDAGDSPEKSKDKAQNSEIDLGKLRIENEKLIDKTNTSEVNVEIPRVVDKKIIDKANNSESELDKFRIEYEKLRDMAQNSEVNVEIPILMAKKIIDKCQNFEVKAEKLRIEKEKLRNNAQHCKVEVEKLRIEKEKLRDNARRSEIEVKKIRDEAKNSEVLVEKLRIDNEKLRGKAQKFEVEVEKLKISNEKSKAKAHNSEVEVGKLRIENEKLGDKALFLEVEVEKLKISNEKLKAKAQIFEVEVEKLRDEIGKINDNKEKSRDESQKLPGEFGEKVDYDDSQSSGDEAENRSEEAKNIGEDSENSGDEAENSGNEADNSSDDAENSGHDADVSKKVTSGKTFTTTKPYSSESTITSSELETSTTESPALCTGGFIREGDLCYLYVDRVKTWDAAADHCRSLDAYLAEPRTKGQIDFLKSVNAKKQYPYTLWLGGTDQAVEGEWVWAHSGAAVDGPTDWIPGMPNDYHRNRRPQDCLEMLGVRGKWNDAWCKRSRAFVCQKEITREQNGQVHHSTSAPADQDSHPAAPSQLPELLPAPANLPFSPDVFTENRHAPFPGCFLGLHTVFHGCLIQHF